MVDDARVVRSYMELTEACAQNRDTQNMLSAVAGLTTRNQPIAIDWCCSGDAAQQTTQFFPLLGVVNSLFGSAHI